MCQRSLPNYICILILLVSNAFLLWHQPARASDYRIGGAIGFGGSGISKSVEVDGVSTTVNRSEGPGTIAIFAEKLYSDSVVIGLEHLRGFRLGPASSGFSFTGPLARWYYLGGAPQIVSSTENTTLFLKKYSLFVGGGVGLAQGNVVRESDQIPDVGDSGVYFEFRLGFDYSLRPGFGIRPELVAASTMMYSGPSPAVLSAFSLQCGFIFAL